MKAVVLNQYGSSDVIEIKEIDKPAIKEKEVLVRVNAASINAGDIFSMRGSPWLIRFSVGFPRPNNFVLGWDLAGIVEAVGNSVTKFRQGDAVFAASDGALAEYVAVAEEKLGMKPANFTFEQTAAVPTAALTALQGLRDQAKLQAGQKVLINGASGGVGTFATQIAKALGAEVTGVCSTSKVDMVRSIGADHVIDYTRENFTQGGKQYDLILDNVGSHSFSDYRRVLAPQGIIQPNTGHAGMSYVFKALLLSLFSGQHGGAFVANSNSKDMDFLKELIEAGKVTPVIDNTYPLSEARAAFRYIEKGHAHGKVVITITPSPAGN